VGVPHVGRGASHTVVHQKDREIADDPQRLAAISVGRASDMPLSCLQYPTILYKTQAIFLT
jgi:hypothetical protein